MNSQLRTSLIKTVERMGYPAEFGALIAGELKTDKQAERMLSYLVRIKPSSAEEIADEMLAIKAEFEKYRQKKAAEYYNTKYNELLQNGLGTDGPDEGGSISEEQ
mgnify:CR=1 FL=1